MRQRATTEHRGGARARWRATLVGLWALLLVGCSGGGRTAPAEDGASASEAPAAARGAQAVVYELTPEASDGAWRVRASLPPLPSGARICAPALGTREGERLEWEGLTQRGRALALSWREDGCFTLPQVAGGGRLEARYRVRVRPEARPAWRASSLSPRAAGAGLFATGETLFLELEEADSAGLRYEVRVAGAEALSSSWSAQTPHPAQVALDSQRALLRSVVWWEPGATRLTGQTASGQRLAVTVDPALASQGVAPEALLDEARCVLAQLEGWGAAPGAAASVMWLGAGWDRSARDGFARGDGVVLQVGADVLGDVNARRELLAHELFHRYNGVAVRFAPEAYEETGWFREGMTSYVASVTLVQAGLWSRERFIASLAEHASSYLYSPAPRGAGGAEGGERLHYDRGMLMSLALDLALRARSGGQRSLQGFWQALRAEDAAHAHTGASLLERLEGYGGAWVRSLLGAYLGAEGTAATQLEALLSQARLGSQRTQRLIHDHGVALRYDLDRVALYAERVTPEGAAWGAGVRPGDRLRPLPGVTVMGQVGVAARYLVEPPGAGADEAREVSLKGVLRRVPALALWSQVAAGAGSPLDGPLREAPAPECAALTGP